MSGGLSSLVSSSSAVTCSHSQGACTRVTLNLAMLARSVTSSASATCTRSYISVEYSISSSN